MSSDLIAMNIFPEVKTTNYCRVCSEFFCCKICRSDHEENSHSIHPECNICIYGRAFLRKPSESLLQHFRAAHWPLHCLFCKTVFASVGALKLHSTCAMAQKVCDQENSDIFIIPSIVTEENYDSPPIAATMHKSILTSSNKHFSGHDNRVSLTTSTPMQKSNERELLQHIPEVITPVDYSDKINNSDKLKSINASSIHSGTSEQSKDAEPPLKRRVTFSEIEIINIETPYQSRRAQYIPPYEMNSETKQEQLMHTPGSGITNENIVINSKNKYKGRHIYGKSDMYVTAYGEGLGDTPKVSTTQDHKKAHSDYRNLTQSLGTTNDDTAWESALMESIASTSEIPSTAENENLTESINSMKSEMFSPIANENLTQPNILTPVIDYNLPQSPIAKENLTESINSIKSEILSPIVNENLTQPNILSPLIDYNLPQSPVAQENLTEAVIESSVTNVSVAESKFLTPAASQNVSESENIQSHIIIVDGDLGNSGIFSVIVNQNLTDADTASIIDSNLKELEVLTPISDQKLKGSDFVPSDLTKSEISLEMLSPITNANLGSGILSSNVGSSLDLQTSDKDINYALESATISGLSINSQKSGIWSSMANIFKTVVQGLSSSTHRKNAKGSSLRISLDSMDSPKTNRHSNSHKRKPELDTSVSESPMRKKIKLTHIKCRRTIRNVRPFLELKYGRRDVETADKWTQTD